MTKLLDILVEALSEKLSPGTETDVKKDTKASAYIKYIQNQINNYKGNNNVIRYTEYEDSNVVEINFPDLKVILSPKKSPRGQDAAYTFDEGKNTLFIFNCDIKTKPKLSVNFDEQNAKHEFIHFLDSLENPEDFAKQRKQQANVINKAAAAGDRSSVNKAYYNSPAELNAHFIEYVMPQVIKVINKEKEIAPSYDAFAHDLLQNPKFYDFYHNLDQKNKVSIDKRMSDYYDDILKNPDYEIQKDDNTIDNNKLEKSSYAWWKKLGDFKQKHFG